MKNTRREFSLFGLGAALTGGGAQTALATEKKKVSVLPMHADPSLSCQEVNLAGGRAGSVIATFSRAAAGREAGEIMFTRSVDRGANWTRPIVIFSGDEQNQGHQVAGITQLANGRLIAASTRFRFLFEGKVRWRRGSQTDGVYLRESTNGGSRWGEIRKLDTAPFRVAWTRGSILELPDGRLLLPLAGQKGQSYNDAGEPIASFVLCSKDGGDNWMYHGTIAHDIGGLTDYDEPAMVNLGGARLLCVLRSHDNPRKDPPGGYLHITTSEDSGETWGPVRKTSMWGHPAALLRLRDGRVLCTYGYRMHPNPGVRGCVSADGVEWKPEHIFPVREFASLEADRLQIGCPSSVELDDGGILTAYQVWSESQTQHQCLEAKRYRI